MPPAVSYHSRAQEATVVVVRTKAGLACDELIVLISYGGSLLASSSLASLAAARTTRFSPIVGKGECGAGRRLCASRGSFTSDIRARHFLSDHDPNVTRTPTSFSPLGEATLRLTLVSLPDDKSHKYIRICHLTNVESVSRRLEKIANAKRSLFTCQKCLRTGGKIS